MRKTDAELTVTWLGTNTILIDTGRTRLLFDPFMELAGGENPCRLEDFAEEENILITHGHFDHLIFVPSLIEKGDMTVFCSDTPADTLAKYTPDAVSSDGTPVGSGNCTVLVRPGMHLRIGDAQVRVLQGRHIRFDVPVILRALRPLRMIRYFRNVLFMARYMPAFKENGETLCYEVSACGKKILLLGSLSLDEKETYPAGCDLLVMPYQGRSDLESIAQRVIERLQPKRILLSHFDDAFPPFSSTVPLAGLAAMMKERYSGIPVVRPTAGKPVRLP